MPNRTKLIIRIQRVIDGTVATAITVAGGMMIIGFTNATPPSVTESLLEVGALLWACVLTAASVAALVGVLLRTEHPGRQQSIAFGLELGGWPFCALCVLLYTVANAFTGGSVAGIASLVALFASLVGKYLRRLAAIAVAKRGIDG